MGIIEEFVDVFKIDGMFYTSVCRLNQQFGLRIVAHGDKLTVLEVGSTGSNQAVR